MRIYISIPITGKCEKEQRLKASSLEVKLQQDGFTAVNPFELGDRLKKAYNNIARKDPCYEDYMREFLANLEDCSHIYLCKGWYYSKGCVREAEHALFLEKNIIYESTYKL